MKVAKLLHNPGAGDEEHDREELVSLIEEAGFRCIYSSTKKEDWKDFEKEVDFLAVAGGDGTVRTVIKELMDRKVLDKTWPIGLLPLGTANNIARTLELEGETEDLIRSWHNGNTRKYDVGRIKHFDDVNFFLESFGYGIFPYLMSEMKKTGKENKEESPGDKLQTALKLLHKIIGTYQPHHCRLQVDGRDYSGSYLLVEVMNTRSIGPNLFLAPDAHPDDGHLDVVLVTEKEKDKFADYVSNKISGIEDPADFTIVKAKDIVINWEGTHVHVDDEVLKIGKETEVEIELKEGLLEFLVP